MFEWTYCGLPSTLDSTASATSSLQLLCANQSLLPQELLLWGPAKLRATQYSVAVKWWLRPNVCGGPMKPGLRVYFMQIPVIHLSCLLEHMLMVLNAWFKEVVVDRLRRFKMSRMKWKSQSSQWVALWQGWGYHRAIVLLFKHTEEYFFILLSCSLIPFRQFQGNILVL